MDDKTMKMQLSQTPTMFTDGMNIATRMDGSILLQFISGTPDRLIENCRTIITKDSAINLLDNLSKAIDHYPVKESENQKNDKSGTQKVAKSKTQVK
jgi:hypothetical protein